jgi:hypothetical protein
MIPHVEVVVSLLPKVLPLADEAPRPAKCPTQAKKGLSGPPAPPPEVFYSLLTAKLGRVRHPPPAIKTTTSENMRQTFPTTSLLQLLREVWLRLSTSPQLQTQAIRKNQKTKRMGPAILLCVNVSATNEPSPPNTRKGLAPIAILLKKHLQTYVS